MNPIIIHQPKIVTPTHENGRRSLNGLRFHKNQTEHRECRGTPSEVQGCRGIILSGAGFDSLRLRGIPAQCSSKSVHVVGKDTTKILRLLSG